MENKIVLELLVESFCPEDTRMRVMVEVAGERHVRHTGDMRGRGGFWFKGLVDEALAQAMLAWKQIDVDAPAEDMEVLLWGDVLTLRWQRRSALHQVKRTHVGMMRTYADLLAVVNELLEEFLADPDGSRMLEAGNGG